MYFYNLTTSNLHYEKFQDGSVKQVDVPFEIPESWGWVRFNNIATILRGGSPRPIKDFLTDSTDGINWIKIGDTEKSGKYITDTREKIKKSGLSKTRLVKKGSFLLTNSMSFGRPYILKIDGAIHDGWLSISDFESSITEDFLYYFLLSRVAYSQFLLLISGAVVKNLNSEKVASIFIPIPPLNEQARITKKIEVALSKVDDYHQLFNTLRQLNNSFPEKLRKSILQYAMQGKLVPQDAMDEPVEVLLEKIREEKQRLFEEGKLQKKDLQESIIYQGDDNSYYEKKNKINIQIECPFRIPKTWKWVKLKQVANIFSGFSFKSSEYSDVGVRIIRISDFNSDGINDSKIVRQNYKQNFNNFEIFENDILIAMTGGTVGKNILIPQIDERLFLNQRIASIRPYYMNHNFIFLMINSPFIQKEISLKKNSTNDNISLDIIQNFFCPLPPEQEQKRIVFRIKKINFLINKL